MKIPSRNIANGLVVRRSSGGGEGLKVRLRQVLGVLFGFIIFAEGAVLASADRPATIEGIGTITASTILLMGLQLAILGFIIMLLWLLEWAEFLPKGGQIKKVLEIIGLIVPIVVAAEGLFLTTNATMISFEDGKVYGRVAAALLSAQLFGFGALATVMWLKRKQEVPNSLIWFAGIFSAVVIMAWGAVFIGCQSNVFITGFGGISAIYVLFGGVVMFLFGLVPLAVWIVHGTKYYGDQVKKFGTIALALTTLTMALGVAGLATIANDFTFGDFFTGKKIWMAAWCGLVFFFSMMGFAAWWSRRVPLNFPELPQIIGTLAALLLATEGVILIGFSGETQLDTIGTLSKTMTMLFSVQVLFLGMLVTAVWLFREGKWFQGNFNRMLIDMLILIVLTIIALEGVATMALAAPITIEGIGTMLESTMQMFGLQLTVLAILTMICWIFREDGSLPKMQRFMFVVVLFLALLIPPALLLG
jgi:hypothetical protein